MQINLIQKKIEKQLSRFLASKNTSLTIAQLRAYSEAQNLAFAAAKYTANLIQPGWTEKQAAEVMNSYLKDHGVSQFFHYAYAWFGERTRFSGLNRLNYFAFMATDRVLQKNEVFILDVAPVVRGNICDIGYSGVMGKNDDYSKAQSFLKELYQWIPSLFESSHKGSEIWDEIDQRINDAGYDNIHKLYPFSVLGHRVYKTANSKEESDKKDVAFINFGMKSYWEMLRRGVVGELFSPNYDGITQGLWAIEPHIGGKNFGIKFEELLYVDGNGAKWLKQMSFNKKKKQLEMMSNKSR